MDSALGEVQNTPNTTLLAFLKTLQGDASARLLFNIEVTAYYVWNNNNFSGGKEVTSRSRT